MGVSALPTSTGGATAVRENPDVDSVREAIRGGSTRRTVVRTGAWSVPVVAVAIAAPSFAASKTICNPCNNGLPVNCTVTVVVGNPNTGPCNCASGLVCATVLNFANVCVAEGTGLTNTDCGSPGQQCFGVCLTAGGSLVAAVNNLLGSLDAIRVGNCDVTVAGSIPTDICVIPAANPTAGTLGTLCIVSSGNSSVATAIASTIAALGGRLGGPTGLVFATQCAAGFSCKPGASTSTTGTSCGGTTSVTVGFCQC